MGRTPWDRTTAAAISSRPHPSIPKREFEKRVRVSPQVAPRVETSVNSANVLEENSVSICVLSHDIFKIKIELRTTDSNSKSVLTEACLDTGAGCVLIREDAVPKGTRIVALQETPRLTTAKGETLSALGTCDLFVNILGETSEKTTEFIVVSQLVVPVLLGTPWISDYVVRIEPRIREVHIALQPDRDLRVPLLESSKPSLIRVASPCVLPPFTETLLSFQTDRSGVSLIRAPRHRHDITAQVKNGLIELPDPGSKFNCWVANFSSRPVALNSGQVVGVAEAQVVSHVFTVPAEVSNSNTSEEWEFIVRNQDTNLSRNELEKLLATLRPHASLWDGQFGRIGAVQHHIPATGPPVATQPYRIGSAERASIDAELQRMKEMDVIEPAEGRLASPAILISKPDGAVSFCVDYRRLNAVT